MRKRILLLVLSMTTLVVLAFAIPLAILVRGVVYDDATKALQDKANRVANYFRSSFAAPTPSELATFLRSVSGDADVSVQLADGTVIGKPPPAVTPNSGPEDGHDRPGDRGRPDAPQDYLDGKLVQLPVITGPASPNFAVVRVYASDDQLHSGETGWELLLALSSLGLLLLGALAAELLTRRLVRPLTRTAETAHRMSAGDVSARAPTDGPREIAEVGAALNRLGARVDELIAEERETVADLSHRLRTPLTALRLDAEALRDPVEAERVGAHVSTLERMLTAVIPAARRPQREGRLPSSDATAVVGERFAFWSALAEDQGRPATAELPPVPLPVRASAEDLAAAVDALLENVIAHTPEGSPLRVRLNAVPDGAVLEVADEGPGIPADALLRGRSDRGSTGLGLDIARRCAELSGGAMSVHAAEPHGAVVTLTLGAPWQVPHPA
jgi:signal transduction histidine kinase